MLNMFLKSKSLVRNECMLCERFKVQSFFFRRRKENSSVGSKILQHWQKEASTKGSQILILIIKVKI